VNVISGGSAAVLHSNETLDVSHRIDGGGRPGKVQFTLPIWLIAHDDQGTQLGVPIQSWNEIRPQI
jgi:hypothetical protein